MYPISFPEGSQNFLYRIVPQSPPPCRRTDQSTNPFARTHARRAIRHRCVPATLKNPARILPPFSGSLVLWVSGSLVPGAYAIVHNLWIYYLSLSLSLSFLRWCTIARGSWGRCSCLFGSASCLSLGYFVGLLSFSFSLSLFLSFSLSLFLSFSLSLSLSFSLSPGGAFGVDVQPIFRPTGTPSLHRRNPEAMID